MKKPRLKRCPGCGGVRRPADDETEEERKSPYCWLCRLRADVRDGKIT